ncbi:MAG TPA: hypothetical protein VK832_04375 [Burkholderiaceae bacterium]|nr:hypothetical protein [Burkholderiaceae bacterium]
MTATVVSTIGRAPVPCDEPSVLDLALEFLRGNSSSSALNSLLGQTAALVNTLKKRAELVAKLQALDAACGDENSTVALADTPEQVMQLIAAMRAVGFKLPLHPPPDRISAEDASQWCAQLLADQEKDMEKFEKIKAKVDSGSGQLARFIDISSHLLQQFIPTQH